MPVAETTIEVEGPAGSLEARLSVADAGVNGVAVVCHPHPLFGGTMNNKVVHYTTRALSELGLTSVRFNFRGVGKSAGSHDQGRGEVEDALAVTAWLRQRYPQASLWLAGFSFGAYVAIKAAARAHPARLITIAPAVQLYDFDTLEVPQLPWLCIQGDADEVVSASAVREWLARRAPHAVLAELAGGSHFFHGRLNDLRETLRTHLQAAATDLRSA